jgi:hypothetical protein
MVRRDGWWQSELSHTRTRGMCIGCTVCTAHTGDKERISLHRDERRSSVWAHTNNARAKCNTDTKNMGARTRDEIIPHRYRRNGTQKAAATCRGMGVCVCTQCLPIFRTRVCVYASITACLCTHKCETKITVCHLYYCSRPL